MDASEAIWPQHEAFYIESMLLHTRQACASIVYVSKLIELIDQDQEAGRTPDFDCSPALDHLQNLVMRAGAISRYFWPVRKSHGSRGARLTAAFNIQENSPLRNVELRHAAEHFDERLDKYLSAGIAGVVMPDWFGPTYPTQVPAHYFRAFFIDTGIFKILDNEFLIQPISNELVNVHNLLVYFDQNGGRLPTVGT